MSKINDLSTELVLNSLIGEGGMGEVYEAHLVSASGFRKKVAAKKLKGAARDLNLQKELLKEAQISSKLNHPNIAQVLDIRQANDEYFIIYEFIDGKSLRTLLDERTRKHQPFQKRSILFFLSETIKALAYAHSQGLVHRDISPSNIMISNQNEIKIIDFGIALDFEKEKINESTKSLVGNFRYFSPERAIGKSASISSDIYSLALVAYEMLSLKSPFQGENDLEILSKIKSLSQSIYEDLNNSEVLSQTLKKMLDPNVQTRINIEELKENIDRVNSGESVNKTEVFEDLLNKKLLGFFVDKTVKEIQEVNKKKKMFSMFKGQTRWISFGIISVFLFIVFLVFIYKQTRNDDLEIIDTATNSKISLTDFQFEVLRSDKFSTFTCDMVFRNILSFPMILFDEQERKSYLDGDIKRSVKVAIEEIMSYEYKRLNRTNLVFELCKELPNSEQIKNFYFDLLSELKEIEKQINSENDLRHFTKKSETKNRIYNDMFSGYYPGYVEEASAVLKGGDLFNQFKGSSFLGSSFTLKNNAPIESVKNCANIIDHVWSYHTLYSHLPKPAPEDEVLIFLFPYGSDAHLDQHSSKTKVFVSKVDDNLLKEGFCVYKRKNLKTLEVKYYFPKKGT